MKIKNIKVKQFKSIYEETYIDFEKMSGLWKVSGKVGAGKTTLGELIIFGLYGSIRGKNINDLISWGCNKCELVMELESSGHNILINRMIRSKGAGELSILINGDELEYTNKKGAQQILESDYYDCSRTAIESLCIISFNNFKSIAQFSPGSKETRKFVDDVFGFNIINDYIEICKNILKESQDKLLNIKTQHKSNIVMKEKWERELEDITLRDDTIDEENIKNELKKLESDYFIEITPVKEKLNISQTNIKRFTETVNKSKLIISNLKKNLQLLKNGTCPICNSQVSLELTNNITTEINNEILKYNNTIKLVKEEQVKYNNINLEIQNINNRLIGERDIINNKLKDSIKEKESKIKSYKEIIDKYRNDIESDEEGVNLCELEYSKWNLTHTKINQELRPLLLQHFIPLLNNNIEYYIQILQQPYTIKFDPNFSCSISMYGTDNIPISSLSTGQLKTVNTSIIFGILKTLLNSINFNISFLDELFSNMHDDLREITCQMIKDNIHMQVVFIITHAHINDELFDGEINAKIKTVDINGHVVQGTQFIIEV